MVVPIRLPAMTLRNVAGEAAGGAAAAAVVLKTSLPTAFTRPWGRACPRSSAVHKPGLASRPRLRLQCRKSTGGVAYEDPDRPGRGDERGPGDSGRPDGRRRAHRRGAQGRMAEPWPHLRRAALLA